MKNVKVDPGLKGLTGGFAYKDYGFIVSGSGGSSHIARIDLSRFHEAYQTGNNVSWSDVVDVIDTSTLEVQFAGYYDAFTDDNGYAYLVRYLFFLLSLFVLFLALILDVINIVVYFFMLMILVCDQVNNFFKRPVRFNMDDFSLSSVEQNDLTSLGETNGFRGGFYHNGSTFSVDFVSLDIVSLDSSLFDMYLLVCFLIRMMNERLCLLLTERRTEHPENRYF